VKKGSQENYIFNISYFKIGKLSMQQVLLYFLTRNALLKASYELLPEYHLNEDCTDNNPLILAVYER